MSKRRKQQSRRPGRSWGGPTGPRRRPGSPSSPPPFDEGETDDREVVLRLLGMLTLDHPALRDDARQALTLVPAPVVAEVAAPLLESMIEAAWAGGWQPGELAWHVRRTGGVAARELAVALFAVDVVRVAAAEIHPAWSAQLVELGVRTADRAEPIDRRWLARRIDDACVAALLDPLAAVVTVLGRLPRIQVLLPVPGRPDIPLDAVAPAAAASGIDAVVLAKVRALLAKAESTTFEAEAQAFTAKAHELMTRHSLEHVVAAQTGSDTEQPSARRLLIDDPYAAAKAYLVQVIAEAARCRAVSSPAVQMSTVVGFPADLDAVEVLFTSLLVQAQTGLGELARAAGPGSRERSRGFRASFLRGFAHRIGERLTQAHDAAVADVDRAEGGSLVPVLTRRDAEVDDQVDALFPHLVHSRGSHPSDTLGWHAGSDAAERAELPWDRLGPVA